MAISPAKRQRERNRQERHRQKEIRRDARRAEKPARTTIPGVDPDIAGIVPGPQPPPEELEAFRVAPDGVARHGDVLLGLLFHHPELAKLPGPRDACANRRAGGILDRLRRFEIRKALREVDGVMELGQPRHLAEDGIGEGGDTARAPDFCHREIITSPPCPYRNR